MAPSAAASDWGTYNLYGYSLCSAAVEHNIITNGFRWTSTSGTDGMRSQATSSHCHCQCSHPIPSPSCRGLRRRQTIFVIVIDVDYVRLDGRVGDCRNGKAVSVCRLGFLGSVTPKSWFIGLTGGEGDLAQNIYEITCAIILPTDDMTMMGMGNGSALGERRWNRDDNYAATNVYLKERPHHHQQQ